MAPWSDWRNGRVVVKDPDGMLIRKMREIAETLGARVQGDDGEYYEEWTPPVGVERG
jgi:hypothetical protein